MPDAVFGCSTCVVVPAPVLAARANGAVVRVVAARAMPCAFETVCARPCSAHVRSSHSLHTRCTLTRQVLAAGSLGWLGWRRSIPERSEQETDNSLALIPTGTPQANRPLPPLYPLSAGMGWNVVECGACATTAPPLGGRQAMPLAVRNVPSAICSPQPAIRIASVDLICKCDSDFWNALMPRPGPSTRDSVACRLP